jgi:hypothetical protein
MKRTEIIEALEAGNYKIEHEEDCGCSFDWRINRGNIEEIGEGNECWEGNILYIGDEMIAQSIRYQGRDILTPEISEDDIPDEIWDEMGISDMVEQGESANNDTHERNRRDSLVDWLNGLVAQGYRLMRDNDRGFANEYTIILVRPNTDDGETGVCWDEIDAEQWATDYLYDGDAVTEAFNSAQVI